MKQAKSTLPCAQQELLREAEKLSRLQDHSNVVNIKGITLDKQQYSLILTLYTSGNLEGFLRSGKKSGSLSLDTDLMRMVNWAYQVGS